MENFQRALGRLEEAVLLAEEKRGEDLYPFLRDSAIQRFEFTFEILWKLIKSSLRELEGIECNSPKSCMRELFRNKYITEEELKELLRMVDDRNLTVHTYHEELAEKLFGKLKDYVSLIRRVGERLEERFPKPPPPNP